MLFYSARLRCATNDAFQEGLDAGVHIASALTPFVERGTRWPATTYGAGDLVRVTLTLRLPKERRFVAVTDPLPAGFEPLESWFATTARGAADRAGRPRNRAVAAMRAGAGGHARRGCGTLDDGGRSHGRSVV